MPGLGGAGRGATVPGGPPGSVRAAGAITLGVEEEFVLLDPSTGATVLADPDLVRMPDGEPGVQQELMRFQVETGTRVCTGLDEVGRELIRLRRLAAAAAAHLGCRLVASGVAPYRTPGLAAVTGQPRYRELARGYGRVVAEAGTCGCHVHVGVPSREAGVQVLARLRPWLAPLLAVSANSPIAGGHETGWASWRYPIQARWPTAVPSAAWPDAAAYDTAVRRLIGRGAALDERSVYFPARLSPRYPTVEVRVADVCLDAGTAVLLARLTRATREVQETGHRSGAGRVDQDGTPADPGAYDYDRAARDALTFAALFDRFVQNLRRYLGYDVQYFAAVEPQKRLAPHVHVAMRGTVSRAEIRRVLAATYHQVWWPTTNTVKYDGDQLPVWDEATGSYLDPATGEVLPTWDHARRRAAMPPDEDLPATGRAALYPATDPGG